MIFYFKTGEALIFNKPKIVRKQRFSNFFETDEPKGSTPIIEKGG